ncbi:MAG: sulfur carrier protein ThiS [Chloroflexi bacterium]|nr:sulfur carrier protein ThiS [Chloroflexota bacterium]
MIRVRMNGKDREIEPPGTVDGLLQAFGLNPRLVVVERNGSIVPRPNYGSEPVEAGDQFEVVQMMAGG